MSVNEFLCASPLLEGFRVVDSPDVKNQERFASIEERLDRIENAIVVSGFLAQLGKHARSAWAYLRNHKLAAVTVATLLVAVFGLWYTVYSDREKAQNEHEKDDLNLKIGAAIDNKVGKQLSDLDQKVTKVEAALNTLQPFIEDLIRSQMKKSASMSLGEFQSNLPTIKHIVAVARSHEVKIERPVVAALEEKLVKIRGRESVDFWQTSAALISYRSFNLSSGGTVALSNANLPNCRDVRLSPQKITKVIDQQHLEVSQPAWENCRVTLDSPEDDRKINTVLLTQQFFVLFRHCLVIYNGGPIQIAFYVPDLGGTKIMTESGEVLKTSVNIIGKAVTFEDCLFDFSISKQPSPDGRKMTEALLAQNSNTLKIPKG